MRLVVGGNKVIHPSFIASSIKRSDLVPVPMTFEATIKDTNRTLRQYLANGKVIEVDGTPFHILKAEPKKDAMDNSESVQITAFLDSCKKIGFVAERPIIKYNQTLASIYRACGYMGKAIDLDFQVSSFVCMKGTIPSYHLATVFHEEGGVVRYKNGGLQFLRLTDIANQTPVLALPSYGHSTVKSGTLEKVEIPQFYTLNVDGAETTGQNEIAKLSYSHGKTQSQLNNMRRVLVRRKRVQIDYVPKMAAGEIVTIAGEKFVTLTACHCFGLSNKFSVLYLGQVNQ